MKLYLVQHGEACAKEDNPDRPLTEKGKADINRLAVFLRKGNIRASRVIHSGKLRAAQTVERLQKSVAPGVTIEISDKINPDDEVARFAELSFIWTEDTLMVGHLPFLAKLVSQLTLRDSTSLFSNFVPGTAICLERNNKNQWLLNWMVRPEILN
jgi:phosphohistidine phosphatase